MEFWPVWFKYDYDYPCVLFKDSCLFFPVWTHSICHCTLKKEREKNKDHIVWIWGGSVSMVMTWRVARKLWQYCSGRAMDCIMWLYDSIWHTFRKISLCMKAAFQHYSDLQHRCKTSTFFLKGTGMLPDLNPVQDLRCILNCNVADIVQINQRMYCCL